MENTKGRLLAAALELIWAQSYGAVSVDVICANAKAKKGSFYHYFDSKSELAIAALERFWAETQPVMDQIFSAQRPPLERLRSYAEASYEEQCRLHQKMGYVVGCPFTSIGSEQCACDDGISRKSGEILLRFLSYFRSAIADAVANDSLPAIEIAAAAKRLLTYELGAMALARITNDVEPLKHIYSGWYSLLTEPPQVVSPATPSSAIVLQAPSLK